MSEELVLPTKESIRKAAEKCPDAKAVLEELFPTVFKKNEPKYCCNAFRELHGEGIVIYLPRDEQSIFAYPGSGYLRFCPYCGKDAYPI